MTSEDSLMSKNGTAGKRKYVDHELFMIKQKDQL